MTSLETVGPNAFKIISNLEKFLRGNKINIYTNNSAYRYKLVGRNSESYRLNANQMLKNYSLILACAKDAKQVPTRETLKKEIKRAKV